ncbi:hypothetical protein G6O67_001490 [Ophiocordyceps sinensis]|uniref:Uncharacterized protein n=3 Tax=Ophiocordyceps sinensis TaxID=72228 RepID=A0A8H4PXH8_9HYPO|nr:hypothetical protein OCS_04573 [Ophiocordyceps sinensis CO18]KAF4512334.1 hypothetical protein G6O67_001490 [Ophiocordyceps sinensis]
MSNDYGRSSFGRRRARGAGRGSPRGWERTRRQLDYPDPEMDRPTDRYRPYARDGARDSVARWPSPGASPSVKNDKAKERGKSTTKSTTSKPLANDHQARAAATKPSPAGLPPKPPSTASSASSASSRGSLRPDVKRATDQLCDRLFWYMQRDAADKKLQRLQFDLDRCKKSQSDFGSAPELIRNQRDSAEEEKAKCCTRLDAADEKLHAAVQQLVARLPQSKSDDGAKPQADHKPIERPAPDLESRLLAAQKSAEASFTRMLSEESSLIKESLRTEFESRAAEMKTQTAELKAHLYVEKIRNEQLRESIKALENKIRDSAKDDGGEDSQKPEHGRQAHATSKAGPAADPPAETAEMRAEEALALAAKIEEGTKNLVSRDELDEVLRKFDKTMSLPEDGGEDGEPQDSWPVPGEGTALKLRGLSSKLKDLESSVREHDAVQTSLRIQKLIKEVDGHAEAIKQQADQQMEAKLAMQTLELTLAKQSASQSHAETKKDTQETPPAAASANASDSHIQDISRAEVTGVLKDFLPTLSKKLTDFLKEERVMRSESISKEAEKAAEATAALRTDLNALRQDCARSLNELAHQVAKSNSDLLASGHQLKTLETTCPAARAETKSEVDELAMQVRDVQSWQDNFTTRPLYKDIVDHINATLPNGVVNQLKTLAMKIEGIEGHLHATEGGDTKRRKVQAANSAPPSAHPSAHPSAPPNGGQERG